jgi:eukaryotic-like serine/threonine-protein kinase
VTLTPGTHIGHYEIVAAIGEGGMGQVYRARDPRLDRAVAIKVLSPSLSTDHTALARFEREAMSVAKLSHPNILSIFEFAHAGSTAFVVMELVEGETLRARLERGALAPRRAVAYALQMARGIGAAHARGITHRDLKPENVMITTDDQVKILDFGLAKAAEPGAPDVTRAVGLTTSAGTILGTFGYMAPEQVRGLAVDHRADMFAFGAVLYEMLSGTRAFSGDTAADSISAILSREPPELDTARLAIPPGLDRIVRRCLEKTPELRFQSANDLAFALETLSTVSTSSGAAAVVSDTPARVGPRRAAWLPWTVAALALIAAAAAWSTRPGPVAREGHWAHFTRITESAGEETSPSLSPDGATVVYAARGTNGWDIYSQRVGGRNATAIINDPQYDEGAPAFSPDGAQIAFHRSVGVGGIYVAGATGESVRRVTDRGFDPAWSPDGKQIAFATEEVGDPASRLGDSTLFVVDVAGGAPRKAAEGDGVQPSWSPSGQRIVYWSNRGGQRDLFTVPAGGGTPTPLTNDRAIDWSPVWSPDGRFVYFSSDRGAAMNLWRIAVDESSGRPQGEPEPVMTGVQAAAGLPRLSKDGARLVFRSRVGSINPVAIPFDPVTLRAGAPVVLDTQNNIRIPSSVSPDGRQIAYFSIGEHQEDLFIGPRNEPMRRVTDDLWRDRAPVFTPDGRSLVFYSNRDGKWGGWMIGTDGGGLRKLTDLDAGAVYVLVSPKADAIVFISDSGRTVFTAPLGPTLRPATELPGTSVGGRYFSPSDWSPDGKRLTGTLTADSGRPAGLAVYDLETKTTRTISTDESYGSKWMSDGRRIVYFTKNGRRLVVLDTVGGKRSEVDVHLPGPSANEVFTISPDSRTIYYGAVRAEADIWIVERK